MNLRCLKTIFILLTCLSSVLLANDMDIEIRPANEGVLETNPDKNITTVFHVTSHRSEVQEYISEVELPEGWKLITQNLPFDLEQNETEIRLLSFYIPRSTPKGTYTVFFHIRGRKYPSIHSYIASIISVTSYHNYSLQILKTPNQAVAGEPYSVFMQLINESNVADTVFVDVEDRQGYSRKNRLGPYFLNAGASRTIDIAFQPDRNILHHQKHSVEFLVYRNGEKDPLTSARTTVNIIPRIQGINDPFHRLPVHISASIISQKMDGKATVAGFQGDIRSEGTLDEKGECRVNLHLRGPDAYYRSLSVYAEREEYVAGYQCKKFGIHAGDRNYSLSDLTQFSRYGRGLELNYRIHEQWKLGSFYQTSRWTRTKDKSIAAYVHYYPIKPLQFHLNWIQLKTFYGQGQIVSLVNKYQLLKDANLELEYARSFPKPGGESTYAFRSMFSGRYQKTWFHVNWIYATPNFVGYFQDTNYLTANLYTQILTKLRFQTTYNYSKRNFERDTTRFNAPINYHIRTGLKYYYNSHISAGLSWSYRNNRDRLNRLFDYEERSLRLQLTGNLKNLSFTTSGETGYIYNHIYVHKATMIRYGLSATFKPWEKQNYSGFLYYEDSNRYSIDKRRSMIAGVTVDATLFGNTMAHLQWQNDYSLEDYYSDRNTLDFSLEYMLKNQHSIRLKGRRTLMKNSISRVDIAILGEYNIPLNAPVSRRTDLCIVRGRMYDVKTNQPLKDVIIHINGSTAATDKNGEFGFYNLTEKTYYLTIDKSSMGIHKVTVQKMPMEITTVKGVEGKFLEIGVIHSGSLSGRVIKMRGTAETDSTTGDQYLLGKDTNGINGSHDAATDQGLTNVIVEMIRDDEVIRRITDEEGRFMFEELRPGAWRVKCYEMNLPDYHQVEKSMYEVHIDPEESETLEIRVIPKKRRIRMLRETEMIVKEQRKDW
ncbi:hypothetical protein ACFL4L_00850 [bacterium]